MNPSSNIVNLAERVFSNGFVEENIVFGEQSLTVCISKFKTVVDADKFVLSHQKTATEHGAYIFRAPCNEEVEFDIESAQKGIIQDIPPVLWNVWLMARVEITQFVEIVDVVDFGGSNQISLVFSDDELREMRMDAKQILVRVYDDFPYNVLEVTGGLFRGRFAPALDKEELESAIEQIDTFNRQYNPFFEKIATFHRKSCYERREFILGFV